MAEITVSMLQAELPANITLDADYPGTASALLVISDILDAFDSAQTTYNTANTVPGGDVSSLTVGIGAEQQIFYPPNQTSTFVTVRPKTYACTMFQRSTVADVYPTFA